MNDRLEAIRLAAHAELAARPKPRGWWVDAALLAAINVGSGAVTMLVYTASAKWLVPMRALAGLVLGVLAVVGAVAAVRPGATGLRRGVLALALGGVALVMLGATDAEGLPFLGGMGCGSTEAVASVVPVAASMVVLSRFAPDVLRALVAGLSAGAGGLIALHFHCPNGTASHLLAFHLVPWVLVSIGAVGLRRLVSSSSFAP